MGFFDIVKILILPAAIAGAIYALLVYLLLPLYRVHRDRYSQYLPLDTLGERTHTFRTRAQRTVVRWLLPRHLQYRFDLQQGGYGGYGVSRGSGSEEGLDEELFEAEEGERMVGFDVSPRERLPVRGPGGRVEGEVEIDSERRLSRELEQGFRDSSESDEGDDRRR